MDVVLISEDGSEGYYEHEELHNSMCELSTDSDKEKANNYEDKASESEAVVALNKSSLIEEVSKPEVITFSSSESGSDIDADINEWDNLTNEVTSKVVMISSSDSDSDNEANANSRCNLIAILSMLVFSCSSTLLSEMIFCFNFIIILILYQR